MELSHGEMERLGLSDYYLTLVQYISRFIDHNYPLSKEDMSAIVNDRQTENIIKRNEISRILKESMTRILEKEMEENKEKLEEWNNGIYSPAITVEEQKEKIFQFIQLMLEDLWNYQNGISDVRINDGKRGIGRK